MAELDKPDSHLTTVKWRFPSVHPEGRKFTLIAGFLALIGFTALPDTVGWLLAGLTIWVAAFFRDPVRTTPTDPNLPITASYGSRGYPPLCSASTDGTRKVARCSLSDLVSEND